MVDELGAGVDEGCARAQQLEIGARLHAAVGDRREQLRIEPSKASELVGVAAIALGPALVDGLQLARVGHDDFVPEFSQQGADPRRVGADLDGDPAGFMLAKC
ncbi:MAG TPA: hypothetical protein VFD82_15975 [Planctomycetota bacterium]|nr:hypothetical protein [Planctomycetota bacterium]